MLCTYDMLVEQSHKQDHNFNNVSPVDRLANIQKLLDIGRSVSGTNVIKE